MRASTMYHLIMSLTTEPFGHGISALQLKFIVDFLKRKGTCQMKTRTSSVMSV